MKKYAAIILASLLSIGFSGCYCDECWEDDDCYSCGGYNYHDDWSYDSHSGCHWNEWWGGWDCDYDANVSHDGGFDYDIGCGCQADHACSSCGCAADPYDNSPVANDDAQNPPAPDQNGPVRPPENDNHDMPAPVSSCVRDLDCASGEICDDASMRCVAAQCRDNSDCDANAMCTAGRCIPCQNDAHICDTSKEIFCVFGSECESGICSDGACLAPGACVVDANCAEGQICYDGACMARPECLSDAECGEGRVCNAAFACEDDVECRADADCGDSGFCVQNMCVECRLDCECANAGDHCINGACVGA